MRVLARAVDGRGRGDPHPTGIGVDREHAEPVVACRGDEHDVGGHGVGHHHLGAREPVVLEANAGRAPLAECVGLEQRERLR